MKKAVLIEIIILSVVILSLSFFITSSVIEKFELQKVYHVVFYDVDGLVVGSPIKMMGVDVGHVTKLQSLYDEVHIDFIVTQENIYIPNGTVATVSFSGLAGSRALELLPPNKESGIKGMIVQEPIRLNKALNLQNVIAEALTGSSKAILYYLSENSKNKTVRDIHSMAHKTFDFGNKMDKVDDKIEKADKNISKKVKNVQGKIIKAGNVSDILGNNIVNIKKINKITSLSYALLINKGPDKNLVKKTQNLKVKTNDDKEKPLAMPAKIQNIDKKVDKMKSITDNTKEKVDNCDLVKIDKKIKELNDNAINWSKNF